MKKPKKKTKLKVYNSTVGFYVIDVRVVARGRVEAKQKIKAKVERMNAVKLIDKDYFYLDEEI